jgi:hypothetical protein
MASGASSNHLFDKRILFSSKCLPHLATPLTLSVARASSAVTGLWWGTLHLLPPLGPQDHQLCRQWLEQSSRPSLEYLYGSTRPGLTLHNSHLTISPLRDQSSGGESYVTTTMKQAVYDLSSRYASLPHPISVTVDVSLLSVTNQASDLVSHSITVPPFSSSD